LKVLILEFSLLDCGNPLLSSKDLPPELILAASDPGELNFKLILFG
jgi:hypothetical protein